MTLQNGATVNDSLTILLVPGLLCDGEIWQHQARELARLAEVRVADLTRQDNITAMANDCLGAVSGPIALIGHSMGGRVALEMTRLAPERIRRLGLLDTGYKPARDSEAGSRGKLVALARDKGMEELARFWLPPMLHPDRRDDRELVDRLTAMVCRSDPDIFARQQNALLTRPDATPVLQGLRCPTLFACGRQDSWSPLERHRDMAALVPGSRLSVIEDAGHMIPSERPEAVTDTLRDWLVEAGKEGT